jgi:SPP1 Gp6-like portal protein
MLTQLMLEQFEVAERERLLRIRQAWKAYHGQTERPLRETKSDPKGADNVRLNFGRLFVNKGVSFLFGMDLQFEVDGEKKSEADTWLSECWDANRRMTTLLRLGINGGVCGHAFLKLIAPAPPRPGGKPPGTPGEGGRPYPRIVVLDPACVTVRWQPDDYEQVISYTIHWHGVDPRTSKPVAYRQVIERVPSPESQVPSQLGTRDFGCPLGGGTYWLITDQESHEDRGIWVTTREAGWPFPWAPVLHCQNLPCPNEFWGLSDLEEDVLAANHALNFVVSNINRILRIHAHPKTWGSGFSATELRIGVDETIVLPGQDAKLQNLEMLSDLSSSLDFARQLKEALHEIARIPEVATGKVENLGQLSGLALQILYGPLVELTGTKRLLYGELLEELGNRLLELGGYGGGHRITTQWPQVLPNDPKGEAETALLHGELGVSRDTLISRLGMDPVVEREKRRREQEEEDAAAQEWERQQAATEER